jgi:2-polyprenyl-3-methyl-5-hydroxy-6-metoxy-1,4-benzoquinol methylase
MIPLLEGNADAVFGSRYLAGERRRVLPYWHTKMNQLLTWLSNMFSNLDLTDMETCYKAFRTDLLKSIPIRSNRFGIEPEITMKAAKRRLRIYEVPISYHGRTYEDGKKIGWKDGVKALGAILYFWLVDDLYTVGYGRAHLKNLTGTPAYVNWIASMVRPYLGDSVLEFDAGLGTLTGQLMGRRVRWVATESDPLYRHALANRFLRSPAVEVLPEANEGEQFDTVLLLNQLERTSDVRARLASAVSMVKPGGRIIVIAQQGPNLFGNIDRTLGHKRRLVRSELATLLQAEGLQVEEQGSFNKVMVPVWWAVSRLVGERSLSKPFLKFFDKTVWLWRRLDAVMPWAGLSCILVAKKPVSEPELETERVAIRGNLHANG